MTKTTKSMTTVTILTGKGAGKEKRYKNDHFTLARAGGVAVAAKATAKAAAQAPAAADAKEPDEDEASDAEQAEAAKTRLASLMFGGEDQFSDD